MYQQLLFSLFFLLFFTTTSIATTYCVTTLDNTDDGLCDGIHCSLREAINAANANAGLDVIEFSCLPVGGSIDLDSGGGDLPLITDQVTIDGSTAPCFSGAVCITLTSAPTYGLEVGSGAGGSIFQYLAITASTEHGFSLDGVNDITILGCDISGNGTLGNPFGTSTGNGISAQNSDNLIVEDCFVNANQENGIFIQNCDAPQFLNTEVTQNGFHGIVVLDSPNAIFDGNTSSDNGINAPVTSSGNPSSAGIILVNSDGATITNNILENSEFEAGLYIIESLGISISNNTICANNAAGIWLINASDNMISNNTICNNTGTGSTAGVLIEGNSSDNIINTNDITGNECSGVQINGGNNNAILENTMENNGCIGIDLNGGNNDIQAPNLCAITNFEIAGSVNYAATIQIFEADPDDPCQGWTLLGVISISAGPWIFPGNFDPSLTYAINATDTNNNTSEFNCTLGSITPPVLMDQTICEGETVTLDAGSTFAFYDWSNFETTSFITVSPIINTIYAVTVADGSGCTGEASVQVIVHPSLDIEIINTTNPTCDGMNDGAATVTGVGGDGNYAYAWSPFGLGSSPSNLSGGIYEVTVSDGNNCTASEFVELFNPPLLTAEIFNFSDPTSCGPIGNGMATVTPSGGVPDYTYEWSPSGGNSETATELSAGVEYIVTVTDANACSVTASVTMGNPIPMMAFISSFEDPSCAGVENGSATVSVNGGDGNNTYVWSPAGGTDEMGIGLGGGIEYFVTVTDGGGCTATTSITLTNQQGMSLSISNTTNPSCAGVANGSATVSVIGGTGNLSYVWSPAGGTDETGENLEGGILYTVEVTDMNGCTAVETVMLTNPTAMTADIFNLLDPSCTGELDGSAEVEAFGGDGDYTFEWSNGEMGSVAIGLAGNSLQEVTITDGNGCQIVESLTLNEPAPILSNILSANDPSCSGSNDGTVTIDPSGGDGNYTFLWLPLGGNEATGVGLEGNISYTVEVTDGNGCTGMASITLTDPPPLEVNILGDTSFCEGGTTTLDAGDNFSTYNWSDTFFTQMATFDMPGNFDLTVTDVNGCTASTAVILVETSNPEPLIDGAAEFCEGEMATFAVTNDFEAYLWSNQEITQEITTNMLGNYSVTVTDSNGCTGETSLQVTENSTPEPMITGSTSFCAGSSTTLEVVPDFVSYFWSTTSLEPSITVSVADTYQVVVVDANGCSGVASVDVEESTSLNPTITGSLSFCSGDTTTLDVGNAFDNYQWESGEITPSIPVFVPGTYTVVVSNNSGCSGEASVEVTENQNPEPSIEGSVFFCDGDSTILEVDGNFDSYLWSDGSTLPILTIFESKTITVTVTDEVGCAGSDDVNIVENSPLNPQILGAMDFCPNDTIILDVAGDFNNYFWSNGSMMPSILISNSGDYEVLVTDSNACSATAAITVTEYPIPNLTLIGADSFCADTFAILETNLPFVDYLWSDGSENPTLTVSESNTYALTVTDANGCTVADSLEVLVFDNPVPSIIGSTTFCTGSSTQLEIGNGFTNYLWSTGAMTAQIEVNTASDFSVTVTNAAGCTGTDEVEVTESSELNPMIVGNLNFCAGEVTMLDAGNGFVTYEWSNGGMTQFANISSSDTYSVTVTDGSGCTGADTVQVEMIEVLPQVMGNLEFCEGGSTTLSVLDNFETYLWSNGETTATTNFSQAGMQNLTVTDANNCTGQIDFMLNEMPAPFVLQSLNLCEGETFLVGNSIYDTSGNYLDTLTTSNGCDSIVQTMLNILPTTLEAIQSTICNGDSLFVGGNWQTIAGTYSDTLTAFNGCDSIVMISLSFQPCDIDVNAVGSEVDCFEDENGTITFTVFSGTPPFDFQWEHLTSFLSGSGTIQNLNEATLLSNLPAGSFNITVTDNGGANPNIINVSITEPAELILNLMQTSPIECASDETGGISAIPSGGTPDYFYEWNTNSTAQNLEGLSSGNYSITLTDANGCTLENALNLSESTILTADIQVIGTTCFDQTDGQILVENSGGGMPPYLYALNGVAFSPQMNFSELSSGNYSIQMQDANGCEVNFENIIVSSPPELMLELDALPSLQLGESINLNPIANFDISNIEWSPTEDLSCIDCLNPTATPIQDITYQITAFYSDNCFTTAEITIQLLHKRQVYVPNAFSPSNEDGFNDVFMIYGGADVVQVNQFQIFNRWGAVVFENTNFQPNDAMQGWDGRFKNEAMEAGTFTWFAEVVFLDGIVELYQGDLTLIR